MRRITKKDIGKSVLFSGYDGKTYRAIVEQVRRGIVTISYGVDYLLPNVLAYIETGSNRIKFN